MADPERPSLEALDRLDLPVDSAVPDLRHALADQGLAVLQAEPGAGKTTAIPLRLLGEPWLGERTIVVLEPRRVAARAAARRMSDLIGQSVGELVGVRTRDDTRVGPRTRIEVVTDGVLTRRLQREPNIDDVGLVVFDEFHERSLIADLGLALALEARAALRPELRMLVMSATLETERVARLLGGDDDPVPTVQAAGRRHPVSVAWQPREAKDRLETAMADAIRRVLADAPGDVLAFLPGAGEIQRTARLLAGLRDQGGAPVSVRPLHGSLKAKDQDRALAPDPTGRRVVLATDIAETSLTVDGVRAVVDSGLARTPLYDPGTGMTRLVTVSTSRASAEQRAGRAGRTAPGRAVRLWSQAEHAVRRAHPDPEISQVDMAGLVLEAAVWGERDPARLALLDPPPASAVAEARQLLEETGALDGDGAPTARGRAMANLPLHPRLAAVVLAAVDGQAGWTGCLIAAALEERDIMGGRPRERPTDLTERLHLIDDPDRDHPAADRDRRSRVRRRAKDLAQRVRVRPAAVAVDDVGSLLLAGFPDRVAQRRSDRRGRFRLRSGAGAFVAEDDALAGEELIVAVDTDGDRRDARVRVAAGIDRDQVEVAFGSMIETASTVAWDEERDDLVLTTESKLGALSFGRHRARPEAGPETVAALLERVRETELVVLPWSTKARSFQSRAEFVRAHDRPDRGPDLSDEGLLDDLDDWLAPQLGAARGRGDLVRVDLLTALKSRLGWDRVPLVDRLAPEHLQLPSGRSAPVAYDDGRPVVRARVQELYGAAVTPAVLDGRRPVVFELTSPADRPIQVTEDLAGFWAGSWIEVRKEMAGRYPKHDWPVDPASAVPSGPGGGRRR